MVKFLTCFLRLFFRRIVFVSLNLRRIGHTSLVMFLCSPILFYDQLFLFFPSSFILIGLLLHNLVLSIGNPKKIQSIILISFDSSDLLLSSSNDFFLIHSRYLPFCHVNFQLHSFDVSNIDDFLSGILFHFACIFLTKLTFGP